MATMNRRALVLNIAAVAICLWLALGPKPTVHAQADVGSQLAVHKERLDSIDKHLQNSDAITDRLWTTVNAQGNAISEMQGEERVFFLILTLVTGGNFYFQVRKKG